MPSSLCQRYNFDGAVAASAQPLCCFFRTLASTEEIVKYLNSFCSVAVSDKTYDPNLHLEPPFIIFILEFRRWLSKFSNGVDTHILFFVDRWVRFDSIERIKKDFIYSLCRSYIKPNLHFLQCKIQPFTHLWTKIFINPFPHSLSPFPHKKKAPTSVVSAHLTSHT